MIFETRINGIPCQCEVTGYLPAVPMRITGPGMGDADPPEPAEFEYRILDRRGRPAAWLERYLSSDVEESLFEEMQAAMTAEKYGYRY